MLAWEQHLCDAQVSDIFGYHAVQLGSAELNALRSNRMPNRWRLDEPSLAHGEAQAQGHATPSLAATSNLGANKVGSAGSTSKPAEGSTAQVLSYFDSLPFASKSLDLLVMPHTLDFNPDPHACLREAHRVLMPEGRILLLGFTPWSLLRLRAQLSRHRAVYPEGLHRFLSVARLKDWMKLLGLQIEAGGFGCYAVPKEAACERRELHGQRGNYDQRDHLAGHVQPQPLSHVGNAPPLRSNWWEYAGDRWWPSLGAVYWLLATRREPAPTLVGLARRLVIPKAKPLLTPAAS